MASPTFKDGLATDYVTDAVLKIRENAAMGKNEEGENSNSTRLTHRRALSDSRVESVGQHDIQRHQLLRREKSTGLLENPPIALRHESHLIINLVVGTGKSLIQIAFDTIRQIVRLSFYDL